MIEKNGDISIQDNFLVEKEFIALRDIMMGDYFPWFFNPNITKKGEDKKISPGQLVHMVYGNNIPQSSFYVSHFLPIREQLEGDIWLRIRANLSLRLTEPFHSPYHIDEGYSNTGISNNFTTSILYINTNNGYTEFEDGTIVESVANRLVSFPLPTRHRAVSQTDEQRRVVINFNYLKWH